MSYNPPYKVFYVKSEDSASDNNRLVPAPKITISPEYYYANNIIIGYTYNININGFATSIDLRTYDGTTEPAFQNVLESIKTTKNIFNNNGGTLLITNDSDNPVFRASGIIVRSLEFNESDNKWFNYAPYSIELEANEIEFSNCSDIVSPIGCDLIPSGISISPDFIDLKKYRVKSFDDNWSFDFNENIYNSYNFSSANFNNEYFNVTYTINAVGKHYFVDGKLLTAWEQAKNFCQYRLYNQINNLINNALPISSDNNGCSGIASLTNIFSTGPTHLLSGLENGEYSIFNETINCDTSEAEGSFSLTYNAILKRTQSEKTNFIDTNTIHTFNVTKNITDDGRKTKNTAIIVQGEIQGLIKGGLIKSSGLLQLPQYGQILLSNDSGVSRYDNALSGYNLIANKTQLKDNFAALLNITNAELGVSGICIDPTGIPPRNSYSVTHEYNNGIISYNTGYDTETAGQQNNKTYNNISITVQDSAPQIAEFIIPGRSGGPIIQNIGCNTPKKITINIDGSLSAGSGITCCPDLDSILESGCTYGINIPDIPGTGIGNAVITENRQNYSTDGSYSLTRAYTFYDS